MRQTILFGLLLCAFCVRENLNDRWLLTIIEVPLLFSQLIQKTFNVSLPSTLHHQLIKAKHISEIYSLTSSLTAKELASCVIKYSRNITINANELLSQHFQLVFHGIDTHSEIFINGKTVAKTLNAFRKYRIQANQHLKGGDNLVEVVISPSVKYEIRLQQQNQMPFLYAHTRKASYQYSMPCLVTMGIWKPVFLESYQQVQLDYVWVRVRSIDSQKAILNFAIALQSAPKNDKFNGKILIYSNNTVLGEREFSEKYVYMDITIEKPRLWWPRGLGQPYLYNFVVSLEKNRKEVDSKRVVYGIRTVEVVRKQGEVRVKVNGYEVYCKGTTYYPLDLFYSRVSNPRFKPAYSIEQALADVVEANFNTLRVSGSGQYQSEQFLEAASKRGILLFLDFMFSGSVYPSTEPFLRDVEAEIKYQIQLARNYPSVAAWVANHQLKTTFTNNNWLSSKYQSDYQRLFQLLIPKIIQYQSAETPFLSNLYNNISNYNQQPSIQEQTTNISPIFNQVIGMQGFPVWQTTKTIFQNKNFTFGSQIMLSEQTSKQKFVSMQKIYEKECHRAQSVELFVFGSSLLQARKAETAIKAQRAKKTSFAGFVYSKLNDAWPTFSQSSIDYFGRWKPLQYTIKQLLADIAVFTANQIIYAVNDKPYSLKAKLFIEITTLSGSILYKNQTNLTLAANSVIQILLITPEHYKNITRNNILIFTQIVAGKQQDMRSIEFLVPYKQLALPQNIKLKVEYDQLFNTITLSSSQFVKNLQIYSLKQYVKFSNNYFDLAPNHPMTISLSNQYKLSEIKETLRYRSYVQIYSKKEIIIQ